MGERDATHGGEHGEASVRPRRPFAGHVDAGRARAAAKVPRQQERRNAPQRGPHQAQSRQRPGARHPTGEGLQVCRQQSQGG